MGLEVIRQMDKLGRICIPIDFRKSFGITDESKILITLTDEGILLKKRELQITGEKRDYNFNLIQIAVIVKSFANFDKIFQYSEQNGI